MTIMTTTPITPDPVSQLAGVINRLNNLSLDPQVPQPQQQQLLVQVQNLSGDLIKLATQQLQATDPDYRAYMTNVAAVTTALDTAEAGIQNFVNTVAGIAALTASINNLIQQGIQLVGIAAKYAAA